MLHDKIQELEIELEDSNTDREKEVVVNEIQTLKCVLGHLFNLKHSEKARALQRLWKPTIIAGKKIV